MTPATLNELLDDACPICASDLQGVTVERQEGGLSIRRAPYVSQAQSFPCGLVRRRHYGTGDWTGWDYLPEHQCSAAQRIALMLIARNPGGPKE